MHTSRQILLSSLRLSKAFVTSLQRNTPVIILSNSDAATKILCRNVNCTSHFRSERTVPHDVHSLLGVLNHPTSVLNAVQSESNSSVAIGNINILRRLGMTNDEIAKCEMMHQGFLDSNFIKSHIKFLQRVDLNSKEICNIMQRVPKFCTSSPTVVENIVQFMFDIGVSRKNVKNLLIFSPSLFYRVKGGPQKIGSLLQDVIQEHQPNVDSSAIVAYMLRDDVKLFNRTEKEVRRNLQFLIQLGFTGTDLVKIIRYCPSALRIGTDFLWDRWNFLRQNLKLTDEETARCIVRLPRILTIAEDKLRERFSFLYGKAMFKPQDLLKNIRVLERSLAHLQSRCQTMIDLNYQGDFIPMLVLSSKAFNKRLERMKTECVERTDSEES